MEILKTILALFGGACFISFLIVLVINIVVIMSNKKRCKYYDKKRCKPDCKDR
jgi:hypothetical protein